MRGNRLGWSAAWALTAVLGLLFASCNFIRYRNDAYRDRELGRARAGARALAMGQPLPDGVVGEMVSLAIESKRYPFLTRRTGAGGRPLGGSAGLESARGGGSAYDKLLYDFAARAEQSGEIAEFVELDRLGGDQAGAAAAVPAAGAIAVAFAAPQSGPEELPLGTMLLLLIAGGLICWLSAGFGAGARFAGIAIAGAMWVGPLWAAGWVGSTALVFLLIPLGVAEIDRRGGLVALGRVWTEQRAAYLFLAPTALAMLLLVGIPFAVGLVLGFYDHSHGTWQFVGLDNFAEILGGDGRSLADPLNFWFTLAVTVAWTGLNVALHVIIGVALALLLRAPWLRARGVYRVLLILPWAIPNYITALLWSGMFQTEYGALNMLLGSLGLDGVSWFSSWATAFAANVVTNTWLGFPFMMVVALGALEAIPGELHHAARVDGASRWQCFRHITLPHLRPAMVPAIVLGTIWTFNMFNVIYLVSDGRPGGGTDILVTEAYRWAFERGERYGMAAAYATLIFIVLSLWAWLVVRPSRRAGATR